MTNEPLILLDHVSVGYGSNVVLSDLELRLERDSFAALLGANGSGKSTLLKTLAGIIPPVSGRILFAAPNGGETTIGYVPQRETLDPNFLLSGLEVAHMGAFTRLRPGRVMPGEERKHVEECLSLTGADAFAHNQFSELSGGQKQRVLIARALVTKPNLLLLDEPTAGIDTAAAQAIMAMLVRLHREKGLAIVLVTHDLPAVRQHIPDVIWLHEGKILRGPVAELLTPKRLNELLEISLG